MDTSYASQFIVKNTKQTQYLYKLLCSYSFYPFGFLKKLLENLVKKWAENPLMPDGELIIKSIKNKYAYFLKRISLLICVLKVIF